MVKRVVSVFLCIVMLTSASIALAGGPPAPAPPACYPATPYGPAGPGGPGGPSSNYWGDAPLPGLCGGIVALPFLVCGSLLGGNTVGAAPAYGPGYAPVSYPPKYAAPPAAPCAPAYPQAYAPAPKPVCGPAYGPGYGPAAGGGMLTGFACLDLCASLLGFGGGSGLLY